MNWKQIWKSVLGSALLAVPVAQADVLSDALRTKVLGPEAELSSYRAVWGSPDGQKFQTRETFRNDPAGPT